MSVVGYDQTKCSPSTIEKKIDVPMRSTIKWLEDVCHTVADNLLCP